MADQEGTQTDLDALDAATGGAGAGDQQQQQQQDDGTQGGAPSGDTELKTALAELTRTMQRSQQATPQQQQKELTEEEKEELWAVWKPEKDDPDFFRKFLRLNTDMDPAEIEKAVKEFQPLFGKMQTGLVRQAVVGARNLFQVELAKIKEEFSGLSQFVQEQKAEKRTAAFHKAYPALADPKFEKVVTLTAKGLKEDDFKTDAEYFKALAEGAAETLKAVGIELDLGKPAEKQNKPAGTAPRVPRSSAGGTGGTGGGASTSKSSKSGGDIDELE